MTASRRGGVCEVRTLQERVAHRADDRAASDMFAPTGRGARRDLVSRDTFDRSDVFATVAEFLLTIQTGCRNIGEGKPSRASPPCLRSGLVQTPVGGCPTVCRRRTLYPPHVENTLKMSLRTVSRRTPFHPSACAVSCYGFCMAGVSRLARFVWTTGPSRSAGHIRGWRVQFRLHPTPSSATPQSTHRHCHCAPTRYEDHCL